MIEKSIYNERKKHPLVIPQIDPDNYTTNFESWLENIKKLNLNLIAIGGSTVDAFSTQNILDVAIRKYNLNVIIYISSNPSAIIGVKDKTALYWGQIPGAQNTFYGWDGLIANSLNINKNNIEPLPTVYVFDDRGTIGTANWVSRSISVPREKPGISLAIAKAAEYLGMRFYIMAGGSGSKTPPPLKHIELLSKRTNLFIIPTSGINNKESADQIFASGADAIHLGSILEKENGFEILKDILEVSKKYPGKDYD